jgi:hypothetical protein
MDCSNGAFSMSIRLFTNGQRTTDCFETFNQRGKTITSSLFSMKLKKDFISLVKAEHKFHYSFVYVSGGAFGPDHWCGEGQSAGMPRKAFASGHQKSRGPSADSEGTWKSSSAEVAERKQIRLRPCNPRTREGSSYTTMAQRRKWASHRPVAEAREAMAVQKEKTRDAPEDLN